MSDPPDAQEWRRVRSLLEKALELPPEKRIEYLDAACGSDIALRREVESLLAAADGPALIDTPAIDDPDVTLSTIRVQSRFAPGALLSHYRIEEKIGEGGMGEVYKAVDTTLGRTVALKVISNADSDSRSRSRFMREAKAASALNHPNIVTIYEFNTQDGVDFIAMEYVEGLTLNNLLSRPLNELLGYARQAAGALAKAHAAGIVHRDLKPNNIMVTTEGLVKVLDFGLARQYALPDQQEQSLSDLTTRGIIVGTPTYMSPEQALGEPVGPPADVFCFGIILYELACGKRPFTGNTALATLDQIARKDPPPVSQLNPSAGPKLSALIARCLEKAPASRPQSMSEVVAAFDSIRSGEAKHEPVGRRQWIAAAGAAVVLAAASLYWYGRAPQIREVTYVIEVQQTADDAPRIAQPSETFAGGTRFRLRMQPPPSGFLSLATLGPGDNGAEQLWILYAAPIESGHEAVTGWYVFDKNPGTEQLWIVWSRNPLAGLEHAGRVDNPAAAEKVRDTLSTLQSAKSAKGAFARLLELRHQ
jgi:eukaryotic-like serine/threonine-protein kinase